MSSGGVEDEVEVSVRPRRCATDFMDGGGSVDWELFFADMYSVEDGQLSFGVDASSEGGGLVTLDEVEAYAEALPAMVAPRDLLTRDEVEAGLTT